MAKTPARNWIPEKEAAAMLGYARPKTLRENVRAGKLAISYTNILGRNFLYSKTDIEAYLERNAVNKL